MLPIRCNYPVDKAPAQADSVNLCPYWRELPVAVGIAGLFMETHPNPAEAKSDGPNAWPLYRMQELLEVLLTIDRAVKAQTLIETTL